MGMFAPMTWSKRPGRWLMITAIFELVLAGVFVVIGFAVPVAAGGMFLTAAILGIVAIGLLFWGRRMTAGYQEAERIRTTGVPGTATITAMRQTGASLNDQPQVELQLQVTTSMMAAYPVTMKEWVPLMLIGALSSGRPLPVKVDPANPQNVVIQWENALSGGMEGAMPGGIAGVMPAPAPAGDPEQVKQQLLASGTPGTATVVSSTPTGQTDPQGRLVYSMMMQVEIDGRPPMQAPAVVGIPPERAESLEPGDSVPIKADPNNPMVMAIDWDNA